MQWKYVVIKTRQIRKKVRGLEMKVGVGCGGVGGVFLKQSSQQPSLTVRWISSLDREQYFDTEVQLAK